MKTIFIFKFNGFKCFSCLILVLLSVFSAHPAAAHRVVVFAWMEGDTVFTQSQFPDGRKIPDARVKVYDPDDHLLLDGKTDDSGEFSFKIPKLTALHIVLEAGMGHQGEWHLTEEEVRASVGSSTEISASGPVTLPPEASPEEHDPISTPDVSAGTPEEPAIPVLMDEKKLEQIVEKMLDKKLAPITRTLALMQDTGPSMQDIFGGIGYILGLMGVGAYFLSRKKS